MARIKKIKYTKRKVELTPKFKQDIENLNSVIRMQEDTITKLKNERDILFKNVGDLQSKLNASKIAIVGERGPEIIIPKPDHHFLDALRYATHPLIKKGDPVNHPSHYTDGKIEVITFIDDKKLSFCLGNAVKYISRAGKKDPAKTIEDLEKAIWYIRHEIDANIRKG
jgi:uncharacterized coiled-coil protein SlyX